MIASKLTFFFPFINAPMMPQIIVGTSQLKPYVANGNDFTKSQAVTP